MCPFFFLGLADWLILIYSCSILQPWILGSTRDSATWSSKHLPSGRRKDHTGIVLHQPCQACSSSCKHRPNPRHSQDFVRCANHHLTFQGPKPWLPQSQPPFLHSFLLLLETSHLSNSVSARPLCPWKLLRACPSPHGVICCGFITKRFNDRLQGLKKFNIIFGQRVPIDLFHIRCQHWTSWMLDCNLSCRAYRAQGRLLPRPLWPFQHTSSEGSHLRCWAKQSCGPNSAESHWETSSFPYCIRRKSTNWRYRLTQQARSTKVCPSNYIWFCDGLSIRWNMLASDGFGISSYLICGWKQFVAVLCCIKSSQT